MQKSDKELIIYKLYYIFLVQQAISLQIKLLKGTHSFIFNYDAYTMYIELGTSNWHFLWFLDLRVVESVYRNVVHDFNWKVANLWG